MDATIEVIAAVPIVGITERVRMDEIGAKVDELLPELMAVAGPSIAGPVIARWRAFDAAAGEIDMELAAPVRTAVSLTGGSIGGSTGRVVASELPGGRAIVKWHVGSYDGLAATWESLREWMEAEGHVCRADPWEEYVSDCSVTPAEELRTRIVWPIE
jgi:hypothetical protein